MTLEFTRKTSQGKVGGGVSFHTQASYPKYMICDFWRPISTTDKCNPSASSWRVQICCWL